MTHSLGMLAWFESRLGKDDMLDASRQLPVPEHRPLNTVIWFDARAKAGCQCFLQVLHLCGGTGTTHRCRPGMACVDDFITMEVVLGEFSARKCLVGASNLLGAVVGEHKTRWPSSQASCSGVHVRLEEVGTFEPVAGTLERRAQEAQARLTEGTCTSAQAVKLRGRAG